jgi:hypothetical protein
VGGGGEWSGEEGLGVCEGERGQGRQALIGG